MECISLIGAHYPLLCAMRCPVLIYAFAMRCPILTYGCAMRFLILGLSVGADHFRSNPIPATRSTLLLLVLTACCGATTWCYGAMTGTTLILWCDRSAGTGGFVRCSSVAALTRGYTCTGRMRKRQ
eukprot:3251187-Rhodomonas_salina.2